MATHSNFISKVNIMTIVFEERQTYLGFSWKIKNMVKFFVFAVVPFGLSTAPFAFIKVLEPLVKYWKFNSIKIAFFFR